MTLILLCYVKIFKNISVIVISEPNFNMLTILGIKGCINIDNKMNTVINQNSKMLSCLTILNSGNKTIDVKHGENVYNPNEVIESPAPKRRRIC